MREYFLYTLLVFLPIAAVMFYILKSYRLSFSAIWSILILSFIIIITFPVSVTKIGTIFTVVVYCIILSGLSLYLMQYDAAYSAENSEERAGALETLSGEGKNDLLAEKVLSADILSSAPAADGKQIAAVIEQDIKAEKVNIYEADENEELGQKAGEKVGDIAPEESSAASGTVVLDDKHEGMEVVVEEELAEAVAETAGEEAEKEDKSVMVEMAGETDGEEDILPAAEKVEAEEEREEREAAEEEGSLTSEKEEKADEIISGIAEIDEDSREGGEDNDRPVADEKELKVIEWLDLGFAAKAASDFETAFAYFYEAWQGTGDSELRYMLALELAEISVILGWYSQGEEILVKCINEVLLNEQMRKELERKRAWLEIIQREIRHLKLEEMPFSKLPRLVKVKAEDEWRRLYI